MVGKTRGVGGTFGRVKTGPGECIFRVTRPNGECAQNWVSNPDVTPLLRELHWLPIRQRVNFKIILCAFKAIHGIAPPYISELISIKTQSAYSLRSANGILPSPSIIKTRQTLGDRAFQVAAPQLWNGLPLELCQNTNISSFKRCLKTHPFRSAFLEQYFVFLINF